MIRRIVLAVTLLASLPAQAVEIIGNAPSWATYAQAAAEKEGLQWHSEPITLKPAPNLIALLKRSQEIAATTPEASGN